LGTLYGNFQKTYSHNHPFIVQRLDWETFTLKTEADQFKIVRKTGGMGCQFLVNDKQKRRCVDKIAISENRMRISSVG